MPSDRLPIRVEETIDMVHTRFLVASLVAAVAFATAPAFGQDTSGAPGKPDREAQRRAAFDRIDTNRDGFIDRTESRLKREVPFDRRDINKDGRLSLEEFTATRRTRSTRAPARDGSVNTQADASTPARSGASSDRQARAVRLFQRLDKDKDGFVSKAEWNAVDTARFDRCDANKDDKLAFDECKVARAAARSRR
jgi:hypothetical protein